MSRIQEIEKHGIDAKGKRNLIRHLKGERLTMKKAIQSKCYDCTGYYADGKKDCDMPECSLYGYMPYREDAPIMPKKERTEKQMESAERLALIHAVARRK